METLLDPKLDYVFKKIFGTEEGKPQLISLLNALLKGQPYIQSLTLNNPEIDKILEDDKSSRLDIKATSDDGTLFDIEIQCKKSGEIPARAVHYMANLFPQAIHAGDKYSKAKVISIWILGENVTKRQNAINNAYMTFDKDDKDPFERLTDSARIIFVELEKFNPKNADMQDLLTGWLSFLKNPAFMDNSFFQDIHVKAAMETLQYVSSDKVARQIYDARLKTLNDRNSDMTIAREEGRQEGIEEGLAEGALQKAIETAKNLLLMQLSVEQIAQATGLSIDEIEQLK